MKRYLVIENRNGVYPVFYVVDSLTGQSWGQEVNRLVADTMCQSLNEWGSL